VANWFVSSVGWTAVTQWAASTAYSVGDIRRQTAPTGTNHRVFRCTTAGTSGGSEPAWNLTKGSTTNDNTAVWTEVTGNSTYNTTSFAAPHAWLQNAAGSGWAAAGDTIYVDDDHAETQAASVTITNVGTTTAPCRIICITSTFSNPPVVGEITTTAVGANIANTGANNMALIGDFHCYGLHFRASNSTNSQRLDLNNSGSAAHQQIYENCVLELGGAGASSIMTLGPNSPGSVTELRNTTVTLNAAGHVLNPRQAIIRWNGGSLTGTVPTGLFGDGGLGDGAGSNVIIDGVDLNSSGTWTSKFLINAANLSASERGFLLRFVRCKVATTLGGVSTGTYPASNIRTEFINSDDTTNRTYREEYYDRTGVLTTGTTVVRTGGASDGVTTKSWKVVSTANCSYINPFVCPDIYQWVDSTGSKNIDIQIANNSSVTATDADICFDVEYMGSSAHPQSTIGTNRPKILATGTSWTDTSGTETWGGSTTNKQRMRSTVTINAKGWIRVRVYVIKTSFTVYIDPLITVS